MNKPSINLRGLPLLATMLVWAILLLLAQSARVVADAAQSAPPTSLSVQQAIDAALRNSPMIRVSQADVRMAGGEVSAKRSMAQPQISANSFVSTGSMTNILNSSPGVMPQNYQIAPPKLYADQNLSFMLPLYTGGRIEGEVRAADKRRQAASADLTTSQIDVALQVKTAYYGVLLAAELVKVAQARVDANKVLSENARLVFQAGKGIEASYQRAQAELADAHRELTSARNQQAKGLLDLEVAMGQNPGDDITLTDMLVFSPPTGTLAERLSDAVQGRPELVASRRRFEAAEAQVNAAKGSQLPQVYGAAMADAFSIRDMPSGNGGTVGITLSLPLLDGGQRRAEIEQARGTADRAQAELDSLTLRIQNEVRQAWLDVDTAAQNYTTAQSALLAAQSAYDAIAMRVQAQKGILVEQLDALATLTRAQGNVAQALYDHATAVARLKRAVGAY